MAAHRVVLTGMGVVAPNGIGVEQFWDSLLRGESGIDRITRFDATGYPLRIAGEIRGFDLRDFINGGFRPGRMARHTQLAVAAGRMAIEDAGLDARSLAQHAPISLVVGVSNGAVDVIERGKEVLLVRGPGKVSPYIVSACQPHAVAVALTELLRVPTRMLTVSSACAAGLDAIAAGAEFIRRGKADIVISGGSDSATNPLTVASFSAAGMVPFVDGEDPKTISRPFDRNRKGGIMAEGSGIVVLERLESALARGATPYLEIKGYGDASDDPGGKSASGMRNSMVRALANACLAAEDVDYVCAHAPSDPVLDSVETAMLREVMGRHAYKIPVTSIKGATGNPLSAAGPHELATCALIMKHGVVPPTTNYQDPDPECDLDYVAGGPRRAGVNAAMINVHGLGGGNSSMIVTRFCV